MKPEIYVQIRTLYKFYIRRTLPMSIYVGRAFANIGICLFVFYVFFFLSFLYLIPNQTQTQIQFVLAAQ